MTNIGAVSLDQVLDIFGFPPIGGEEGARRVQTLNMVNADIIDKYQLGSTGQTTETDPPPDDPPERPRADRAENRKGGAVNAYQERPRI